jgi:hypothetical protein
MSWLKGTGLAPESISLVWGDYTCESGYSSAMSFRFRFYDRSAGRDSNRYIGRRVDLEIC